MSTHDRRITDAVGFCKAFPKNGIEIPVGGRSAICSSSKQCANLGLNRTSIYYTPPVESEENLNEIQKNDAKHSENQVWCIVVV